MTEKMVVLWSSAPLLKRLEAKEMTILENGSKDFRVNSNVLERV